MKIIDCEQGSPGWIAARIGIPTASNFSRILTPGGKISKAADTYLCELLAEWMLDTALDPYVSEWMERGKELEDQAIAFYELQREVDTQRVGFVTNDARTIGCSPDRLVGERGGLEIKCPSAANHVAYMIDPSLLKKHVPQVQGGMMVCDREWWDVLSFHPELPPALIRVERDSKYIGSLAKQLDIFLARLFEAQERLRDAGYTERDPMGDPLMVALKESTTVEAVLTEVTGPPKRGRAKRKDARDKEVGRSPMLPEMET